MTVLRALLPEEVGRDEVDALADERGWLLVNVHPGTADAPRRVFFATGDGEGWVTLVEEPRMGACYLEVAGHDPESLLDHAVAQLGEQRRDAVLESLQQPGTGSVAHLGHGVSRLAVARPAVWDETLQRALRQAETHAAPEVKRAAAGVRDAYARERPLSAFPLRPRLASSVHCGRHVEDGVSRVMLVDVGAGVRVQIEEAYYLLLTFCDGTRDLDDLCLAASREGIYGGQAGIRAFLDELHEAGLLRDGLSIPQPAPPVAGPEASPDRPLAFLPDYGFECDGRGSCCRFYGMVAFDPGEAREAEALAARMHLPVSPPHLFTPFAGAQLRPYAPRVVAQESGRCLFLEKDAGCGLHRVGGTFAKPFPCRTFPTTLVDDGTEVRVSVGPECACVFRSLDTPSGARLLPESAVTLSDVPAAPWRTVPEPVPLTRRDVASRSQLRTWSTAVLDTLVCVDDVPAFVLSLADALPATFEDPTRMVDWRDDGTLHAEVDAHLDALAARARQAVDEGAHTNPPGALATRVANWMARALEGQSHATLSALPCDLRHERFYVRCLAFGHRLAPPGTPLRDGLIDRAVRLLAARALEQAPIEDDAATPAIALLEAAMRNLSLAGYAARVASL
ncbi:MAG: hypothetical protein AB8I08_38220 [Sandaracinaceae bacterium]